MKRTGMWLPLDTVCHPFLAGEHLISLVSISLSVKFISIRFISLAEQDFPSARGTGRRGMGVSDINETTLT